MALLGIGPRGPRRTAAAVLLAAGVPAVALLLRRRAHTSAGIDAVDLVLRRHRQAERLVTGYRRAPAGAARRRLIAELRRLLSVHESVEEQLFHPAVRAADPDGPEVVAQMLEQELMGTQLLRKLEKAGPDGVLWEETADELVAAALEHARAEEERLLPLALRSIDDRERRRLGLAMRRAERLAPTHPHPAAPDTPPATVLAGVPTAVLDRTRDALTRG